MNKYKEQTITAIKKLCGDNAPYVLKAMDHDIHMFDYYIEQFQKGRSDLGHTMRMLEFCAKDYLNKAGRLNDELLTPATAKAGDGATICLWSDNHACTIVKVTKKSVTVRRDKAILDPNFKPEFILGGFAGHCINQEDQRYTYERDPNGSTSTYFWSDKYNSYGTPGNPRLIKGRHEFYDYNF